MHLEINNKDCLEKYKSLKNGDKLYSTCLFKTSEGYKCDVYELEFLEYTKPNPKKVQSDSVYAKVKNNLENIEKEMDITSGLFFSKKEALKAFLEETRKMTKAILDALVKVNDEKTMEDKQ